ncbi:MAG: Methyl-accepting chemotaxis protein signaling domain protein [Candidatus Woesebacteria bacterium GW2011_GWB1_45_5]|uniref:Methyl-accepting chemotaxis protein signaling domain protein n=1 Tax=Candidatus Woesebacteria bacterium GW2011_GWB1_45_5 TaxID=1618581 RepID=A0A0G1QPF5_9BACT|nr:MAG: Methyl-accepting chemotaxis protein signaling domain protein [Candidatus Woesebacteria bacterium GW2011_GWB1_45_5]
MWTQFFLVNAHFALNLFAGLVFFAIAWLFFDAWLALKKGKELPKIVGFGLLSLSFVVHSTLVETSILGGSTFISFPAAEIETFLKLVGFLVVFTWAISEESPPIPGKTQRAIAVSIAVGPLAYFSFFKPIFAILAMLAYLKKATSGLERHLKPLAIGLALVAVSELLSLASLMRESESVEIYNLVSAFGPIWIAEHITLLFGILVLGRWVFGYLLKQFRVQLFMIFTTTILAIFLATTISFTALLVKSIQDQTLAQLATDAKVLELSLDSKKQQAISDASLIAQNTAIGTAIDEKNRTYLMAVSEDFLVSKDYSFLVVTDANGQVLARGEDPDKVGDSVSSDGLIKKALSGEFLSDFQSRQAALGSEIAVRAASPIKVGDEIKGTVLLGTLIDNSYVDGIKKATGLEASIYGDNTLSATTLLAGDGKTRLVGLKEENRQVKDSVLLKGKNYGGAVSISGLGYFGSFIPLQSVDGNPVGMIFVGKPQVGVLQTAGRSIELTFVVAAILLVLSVFPSYFLSKYLSDQIK